ncbi:hypothetical protein HJC23_011674 [Cyclotella cryptica]|uniref:Uncharacterized protein n=1 Tax=Cyclotella cryptica TaxID=29204 RepID=A0ABD3QK19_9STRA
MANFPTDRGASVATPPPCVSVRHNQQCWSAVIAHFATDGGFAAGVASEKGVGRRAGRGCVVRLGRVVFDLPEAALCGWLYCVGALEEVLRTPHLESCYGCPTTTKGISSYDHVTTTKVVDTAMLRQQKSSVRRYYDNKSRPVRPCYVTKSRRCDHVTTTKVVDATMLRQQKSSVATMSRPFVVRSEVAGDSGDNWRPNTLVVTEVTTLAKIVFAKTIFFSELRVLQTTKKIKLSR